MFHAKVAKNIRTFAKKQSQTNENRHYNRIAGND